MLKTTIAVLLASGLLSTTVAAQEMTADDVAAMVNGKTAYLELAGGPRGKGAAAIFYGDDNKAAARFPNGTAPKGTWSTKGNEFCIAWEDQPSNPCSLYVKAGEKINIMSADTKQLRATIERLVAGNAEKL